MKNKWLDLIKEKYKLLDKIDLPSRWNLYLPILIVFLYLLIFTTISKYLKAGDEPLRIIISPQTFFFLSLLAIAIILRLKPSEMGLSFKKFKYNLCFGIAISLIPPLAITLFMLLPLAVYQLFTFNHITMLANFAKGEFPFGFIGILQLLILAPILEELFFRGFLIPPLKKSLPLWAVITASSLIFMLAHGYLKFGAFLLGLFTSIIFIWTGSVIPAIIFHFTSNLWGPLLIYFLPEVYKILYFLFK